MKTLENGQIDSAYYARLINAGKVKFTGMRVVRPRELGFAKKTNLKFKIGK